MTLFIYRGLPASGKTTLAKKAQKEHGGVRASRDDIRQQLFGGRTDYSNAQENRVTDVQTYLIEEGLRNDQHVHVDDMNLRPKYVRRLINIADKHGSDWAVIDLTYVSLVECVERDMLRGEAGHRRVGGDLINDLHTRFVRGKDWPLPVPEGDGLDVQQRYTPTPLSPYIILVDLDGTLAIKGDRDIYDGSRAELDMVDVRVQNTVLLYSQFLANPIFMSGRDATWHAETERWLNSVGFPATLGENLFMRAAGDKREDSVVKYELFMKHIQGNYNVELVLDDRDQVVKMWRDIGLKVYQVAPGAF